MWSGRIGASNLPRERHHGREPGPLAQAARGHVGDAPGGEHHQRGLAAEGGGDVAEQAPAAGRVALALHPLDRDDQVGEPRRQADRVAVGEEVEVGPDPAQRLPHGDAVGQARGMVRDDDDAPVGRQAVEAERADVDPDLAQRRGP
jgi:hypothetical protein